jgi:hypothetical protein
MFDIVAPLSAPQVYTPPWGGVQHRHAPLVMDTLRKQNGAPVGLWRIINKLASTQQPAYRSQRRFKCMSFWIAIRELIRAKLIFRHGSLISTKDFHYQPRRKTPKHPLPSARDRVSKNGGSNHLMANPEAAHTATQPVENKLAASERIALIGKLKTESATPSADEITAAASALAKNPRQRKIWSGWIGPTRSYRGLPIKLPNGESVFAFGALRGRVVWSRGRGELTGGVNGAGLDWGAVPAMHVKVIKNPSAQLLGRLKRGKAERPSALKAAAAQANGCMPPRPGRRRGRPRRPAAAAGPPPSPM